MCVCVLKWKQAEYIHLFIPNKILKRKPKKKKSNDEKFLSFACHQILLSGRRVSRFRDEMVVFL